MIASISLKKFAKYCDSKYCVGMGKGLDALFLSLKASGIKEGGEVIVPSNTYIATALAVTYVGAAPVFVEPDICTFNINPSRIEEVITDKTKAIMPIHLYGQPCDRDSILTIVKNITSTLYRIVPRLMALHIKEKLLVLLEM